MDADQIAKEYNIPVRDGLENSMESHFSHGGKKPPPMMEEDRFKERKAKKKKKKKSKDKKREAPVKMQVPPAIDTPLFLPNAFASSERGFGYSVKHRGDSFMTPVTATTMGSGSDGIPSAPPLFASNTTGPPEQPHPFASIDTTGASDPSLAQYHSEMLQGFLKQNGQDDKVAMATAMAFETFLQSDTMIVVPQGTPLDEEESRMEQMERMINEDTFSANQCWDNESFFRQLQRQRNEGAAAAPQQRYDAYRQTGAPPMPQQYPVLAPINHHEKGSRRTSFQRQLTHLPTPCSSCVRALKKNWEEEGNPAFDNEWYIRFAKCSPGHPFTYKSAWKVMKKFNPTYLDLSITNMELLIRRTRLVFPVPGLKSNGSHNMFYMKANRYFPKKTPIEAVLNQIVYTMSCMLEDDDACSRGIGFIMDMTDWRMSNFSLPLFHKLLMILQGRCYPTRIRTFLLLNAPSWFGNIWATVLNPMLHKDFKKKVHRISLNELPQYLAQGFRTHLPDDIPTGQAKTDNLVWQFVAERKEAESSRTFYC